MPDDNNNSKLNKYKHTDNRGRRGRVMPDVNWSEVARKAGIDRAHLNLVVNGKQRAGLDVLRKLQKVLRVRTVEEVEAWLKGIIGTKGSGSGLSGRRS